LLLAGRFPAYLRRADGMRSFLESVVVDKRLGVSAIRSCSRSPFLKLVK
jgi:hypothetical protein